MKWSHITISTSHEAAELVASLFEDLGAGGAVIDDPALLNAYIRSGEWDYTDLEEREETSVVRVSAYIAADERLREKAELLRRGLADLQAKGVDTAPADITEELVEDEDWAETWKAYFHPEKIGEKIVIAPTWETYEAKEGDIVVRLDPGAAFGTGQHETTALCIRALERLVEPGMRVFDVGTGSGVLSICAAKLGAGDITAMDFDPIACRVARENIEVNGVGNVEVFESDLLQKASGRADLIIANIVADIIIRMFENVSDYLEDGGKMLLSGIIDDRVDDVLAAAKARGIRVESVELDKGWAAMVARMS
ncbi:50S ribosomal protein L11 methyltransferase [Selenomonas sp. TAMA-11512]|uniref:50S ribosomal protein L11 methyltransferase n=1 Tax=Selenomonas sp. TAMA-11512 TaxID=3095337 RepID=UPI0030931ABB|nr:50S ribosomal protein L11 methyltransferase [Selenomonas sp. TAMA-11512]